MLKKVIVDADACPKSVLASAQKICHQVGLELWTVASFNHNISSANHITVGNASQEADIQVMNLTKRGDIVITQDWVLLPWYCPKVLGQFHPGERYLKKKP
ncbi:hypothetical protein N752_18555 [Desulforamulus aquiferis]|nr:hypothetical protein N752_18555 [Desulforamulus aquiferis]